MQSLETVQIYWSTRCLTTTHTIESMKLLINIINKAYDNEIFYKKDMLDFNVVKSIKDKFDEEFKLLKEYDMFYADMENKFKDHKGWPKHDAFCLSRLECTLSFSYEETATFYFILSTLERNLEDAKDLSFASDYIIREQLSQLKRELEERLGVALLPTYR